MSFSLSYVLRRPVSVLSRRSTSVRRLRSVSSNTQCLSYSTKTAASANAFTSLPYLFGGVAFTVGIFSLVKASNKSSGDARVNVESKVIETLNQDGIVKVRPPREVLKALPVTKNMISQDNLFDKMMEVEMVKEIHCYYDPNEKEFHSVVHLGKEVCGYPNTVHGGLTAAIMDETFGGLMFNVWKSGVLGLSLPAVTSRLEVDYIKRLPQNSVVMCTTKMDQKFADRCLWMTAELTDEAKSVTYATAKACFKTPKWSRSALGWMKGMLGY